MGCTYCFVDTNTGSPDIELDELEDGFQLLVDFNRGRRAISYQWFGGEPLIRRDLIIAGDRIARDKAYVAGLIARPTIVTNGTILNEELVDHFREYRYGVGVSIDGPPNVNSIERRFLSGKTSERVIERNIAALLRANIHVGANVTPTAANFRGLIDSVKYVLSLGIRFIYVNSPIPIRGYWVADGASWAQALQNARLFCLSKGAMLFSHLDRVYQAIDTRKPRVFEHVQGCGGLNAALLAGRRISVLDLNWRCSDYIFALDDIRAHPELLSKARKALFPSIRCRQCIAAAICGGPSINDQLLIGHAEPLEQYCRFFEAAVRLAVLDPTGLQ
jgi:sulfatase maturation enzyme AslB (radical SAM superfamily)